MPPASGAPKAVYITTDTPYVVQGAGLSNIIRTNANFSSVQLQERELSAANWISSPLLAQLGIPLKVMEMSTVSGVLRQNYSAHALFLEGNLNHPRFAQNTTKVFKTDVILARCDHEDFGLLDVRYVMYFVNEFSRVAQECDRMPEGAARDKRRKKLAGCLTPENFAKEFESWRAEQVAANLPGSDTLKCLVTIERPRQLCVACGGKPSTLSLCARCKAVYYCNRTCQKQDWDQHKKTCGKRRDLDTQVPVVFVSPVLFADPNDPGRPDPTNPAVGLTPGSYPKYLLQSTNVFRPRLAELLGSPLLIIQGPINIPTLDTTRGHTHLSVREAEPHASLLMMQTDPDAMDFTETLRAIHGHVAFARPDGARLDWRLVDYMVKYAVYQVRKRGRGEWQGLRNFMTRAGCEEEEGGEEARKQMHPERFRGLFPAFRESWVEGSEELGYGWIVKAWCDPVPEDFF